jgi:hypothetical protein
MLAGARAGCRRGRVGVGWPDGCRDRVTGRQRDEERHGGDRGGEPSADHAVTAVRSTWSAAKSTPDGAFPDTPSAQSSWDRTA